MLGLSRRAVIGGFVLLWATGCGQRISVSVSSGPIDFQVSATELGLPADFDDGGRIAEVPCRAGRCPLASMDLPVDLACDGMDRCDPQPVALEAPVGDVVDFDRLAASAGVSDLLAAVEGIEIDQMSWNVTENSLTFPVPPSEIHWGPEAATRIDPAQGVRRLGRLPAVAPGSTDGGDVQFDAAGKQALSDYLVNTDRRVRFFLGAEVDVDPGDPFPAGSLRGDVQVRVVFEGPGL